MIYIFLTYMSIGCHLPFDPQTHLLCIILNYKNLNLNNFIDDMIIDLYSSLNFVSIENIQR